MISYLVFVVGLRLHLEQSRLIPIWILLQKHLEIREIQAEKLFVIIF